MGTFKELNVCSENKQWKEILLPLIVWIPKTNTSPMELASDVIEGAQNLKNNIVTHVSSLFSGDEGITMKDITLTEIKQLLLIWFLFFFSLFVPGAVSDINFDPMKVVTDTVEEFSDRRDMFLSYLSNVLMENKGMREIIWYVSDTFVYFEFRRVCLTCCICV